MSKLSNPVAMMLLTTAMTFGLTACNDDNATESTTTENAVSESMPSETTAPESASSETVAPETAAPVTNDVAPVTDDVVPVTDDATIKNEATESEVMPEDSATDSKAE